MWFYIDPGWFVRREPEGGIRVVVLNGPGLEGQDIRSRITQLTTDGDTFKRLLAHLTGQSFPAVEAFLAGPPRGS